MLKQNKTGLYQIKSLKEAREAAQMLEERKNVIKEIEDMMDEEYDYRSVREEATNLKLAIESFMTDNDREELDMKDYRWRLIKASNRVWNPDKLRNALGKALFLKVCKVTPDPDKIDELVREGKIDLDRIEHALDEFPKKPFIRRFENTEAKGDDEAERLAKAMS